jgi:hypothetical protein
MELLTSTEKDIVERLGECARSYSQALAPGPCYDQDLREFIAHIHDLQWRVLAQAAARHYPELYRLQGTSFKENK